MPCRAGKNHVKMIPMPHNRPHTHTMEKRCNMKQMTQIRKRWWILGFVLLSVALLWPVLPAMAAQGARTLRLVVGNERVAALESLLFTWQDKMTHQEVAWGLVQAEAPWQVPATALPVPTATATPSPTATALLLPTAVATKESGMSVQADHSTALPTATQPPTATPLPTATPTATPWQLTAVTPFGLLEGEGVWSPYVNDGLGQVVGYRTFLQPDAERPLSLVGVVAFDLNQTRLHFVLGSKEPSPKAHSTGEIPSQDEQPNRLLAAFNGGFMATHGAYGAMAGGVEALPPQAGIATLVINGDGTLDMGTWGETITPTLDALAWRQNAYLVVENGAMTAETRSNSMFYWSGSIDNEVVTWRSGIGLSADGKVLYYFAGNGLDMVSLGEAMVQAGVDRGMLLDINPYWVHFTTIQWGADGTATAEALFPNQMQNGLNRFLHKNERDFFYVTAVATP